jgi:hypothetical protein
VSREQKEMLRQLYAAHTPRENGAEPHRVPRPTEVPHPRGAPSSTNPGPAGGSDEDDSRDVAQEMWLA